MEYLRGFDAVSKYENSFDIERATDSIGEDLERASERKEKKRHNCLELGIFAGLCTMTTHVDVQQWNFQWFATVCC